MDFRRLAKDVVAASNEARRLAAGRLERFGLFGNSLFLLDIRLGIQFLDNKCQKSEANIYFF
jgi:hypothetical protein